jgi:hypothetical protein
MYSCLILNRRTHFNLLSGNSKSVASWLRAKFGAIVIFYADTEALILKFGVADGTRTHDNWNHNLG